MATERKYHGNSVSQQWWKLQYLLFWKGKQELRTTTQNTSEEEVMNKYSDMSENEEMDESSCSHDTVTAKTGNEGDASIKLDILIAILCPTLGLR